MSSRPSFNYHYERLNNNDPNCSTLSNDSSSSNHNHNSCSNGSNTSMNKNEDNHLHPNNSSKHHSSTAHHSHSSSTSSVSDIILSSSSTPSSYSPALVQIPFRLLIQLTVALPLIVFIFNILYVLHLDFEMATNTKCQERTVRNLLPSFSAVIGKFNVPKSLWNIAIALHATPRFLFIGMTYSQLLSIIHTRYYRWIKIAIACHFIENVGLIVLSYVPSNVHFPIHMWSFISFLFGSELFMLIYCILLSGKKYRNIPVASTVEARSISVKWKLFYINIACTILSTLAYYRHENHCEDGIYTLFAFFEYIVVFTNMGFHLSSYWDFSDKVLRI